MNDRDLLNALKALKPEPKYAQWVSVTITIIVLITGVSSGYTQLHTNQQHFADQFKRTEQQLERIDQKLSDNHDRLFAVESLVTGLYEDSHQRNTRYVEKIKKEADSGILGTSD